MVRSAGGFRGFRLAEMFRLAETVIVQFSIFCAGAEFRG